MGQRILVTGASGFLGRYVLRALAGCDVKIVALTHRTSLPEWFVSLCTETHAGDINDGTFVDAMMKDVDAVCHLAAFIPPSYTDPRYAEMCFKVNALATRALADTASRYNVKRFVYLSAGNAYLRLPRTATEDDPIFPSDAAPYYLLSKFAGEVFLMNTCNQAPMTPLILRLGTPYGPGEAESKVVARFMKCASRGQSLEVFNDGRATYNFIHAKDAAHFIVQALTSGEAGVYNIGTGSASNLRELAETIARCYADRRPTINLHPADVEASPGFPPIANDKARLMWPIELMTLEKGIAQYRSELDADKPVE